MARERGEQSDARNTQGQQSAQSQQSQQSGASAGSSSASGGESRTENRPGGATGRQGGAGREADRAARADSERSIAVSSEGGRMQRAEQGRARGALARRQDMGGPMLFRAGFPPAPWELMRRMAEEMTQLIDGISDTRSGAASMGQRQSGLATASQLATAETVSWVPQIDVVRRPDAVVVRADLPGIPPDDIVITVDDGLLTIAGEREEERREDDQGVTRNEVVYGSFYREIPLPDGADESRVTAAVRNGVLEITVPVAEREHGRRVRVQS